MSTSTPITSARPCSALDRAIIASVAAMTIFVLSQQLDPAPSFAVSDSIAAQRA